MSTALGDVDALGKEESRRAFGRMRRPRADLQHDMRLRADEVLKPRKHVGYFEWLVWSRLVGRPVDVLIGEEVLNVSEIFGGGLGLNTSEPACLAIATTWNRDLNRWCGESAESLYSRSNHFLIGTLHPPPPSAIASLPLEAIEVAASKVGWGVLTTVAQGDCGIDAMAYHSGRARDAESWDDIREDLAGAILSLCENVDWQDAFETCQEGRQGGVMVPVIDKSMIGLLEQGPEAFSAEQFFNVDESALVASIAASVAESSPIAIYETMAAVEAPAPTVLQPCGLAVEPVVDEASVAESSTIVIYETMAVVEAPAPTLLQPCGLAVEPVVDEASVPEASVPEASVPEASAPEASLVSSASVTDAGLAAEGGPTKLVEQCAVGEGAEASVPRSFVEHLRTMDDSEQRAQLASDYFRFKEAEAKWNSDHPRPQKRKIDTPRREYRCTRHRQQLAMGEAYSKWLRSPVGQTSKAPLKVICPSIFFLLRTNICDLRILTSYVRTYMIKQHLKLWCSCLVFGICVHRTSIHTDLGLYVPLCFGDLAASLSKGTSQAPSYQYVCTEGCCYACKRHVLNGITRESPTHPMISD